MADFNATGFNHYPVLLPNAGFYDFRDRRAALANGSVLIFGVIHAGAKILDWFMANTASSASATMSIGYRNADGTTTSPVIGDHATFQVPSATAFLGATSIAAAARTRAGAPGTVSNGAGLPLRLQKDIIIIGTLGGADIATDTIINVVFAFEHQGVK